MHVLSDRLRSEFLAVPQLARFTFAMGANGFEATLLIKSTTLALKYLLRQQHLRVIFLRISESWLAYGVEIEDGSVQPSILWSFVECKDEIDALQALVKKPTCAVFLFNELAVNVAQSEIKLDLSNNKAEQIISSTKLHPVDDETAAHEISNDGFFHFLKNPELNRGFIVEHEHAPDWHPMRSYYITNSNSSSLISMIEDEGKQQEEIALWLMDNLQTIGAALNPDIQGSKKKRELCDLLMSYEYGSFLVESKTLSIMNREAPPSREKLTLNLNKKLGIAISQLTGAVKNLRRGFKITDAQGQKIEVDMINPAHVIVLVPDLSLLANEGKYGGEFISKTFSETECFFHILDVVELTRMVQAAEMISERSMETSPIMAFDYHLMNRWKYAVENDTPNFDFLIRFS